MAAKQKLAHEELTSTFPPESIMKWEEEISSWNENPDSVPDPYEEPRTSMSLQSRLIFVSTRLTYIILIAATVGSTRLAIAEEEAKEIAAGTLPLHDVSPGVFIQLALELEEHQYVMSLITHARS